MKFGESVTGRYWILPDAAVTREAERIMQRHDTPELLARVLAMRGVAVEDVPAFLDPRIRDLMPDPNTIADMARAAERLAEAVTEQQRVGVFGDYDVDGACSIGLLVDWLRQLGLSPRFEVPDRLVDGFGPNPGAMHRFGEACDLVLTVDCGSAPESASALDSAVAGGAEVIVVDHHPCEAPPEAAIAVVNPNRSDDRSELGDLCAAAVVFMLLVATNRVLREAGWFERSGLAEPNLMRSLDMVALASMADVVPLRGLNRALVRRGLNELAARRRAGMNAVVDAARLRRVPDGESLSWRVAPLLNAPGRIGRDCGLAAQVLLAETPDEAESLARRCVEANELRRKLQDEALDGAMWQVRNQPQNPYLAWVAAEDWHPGVVGVVAGRLADSLRRPSLVLGLEGSLARGSGRSVAGLDLGEAVQRARQEGLLRRGGGHAAAVGIEVDRDRLPEAMARIAALLEEGAPADFAARKEVQIAGVVLPSAVTLDTCEKLRLAAPYGRCAPQPRFAFRRMRINRKWKLKDRHYRLELADESGGRLNTMAFSAVDSELGAAIEDVGGEVFDAMGEISVNEFAGGRHAQFRLEDVVLH